MPYNFLTVWLFKTPWRDTFERLEKTWNYLIYLWTTRKNLESLGTSYNSFQHFPSCLVSGGSSCKASKRWCKHFQDVPGCDILFQFVLKPKLSKINSKLCFHQTRFFLLHRTPSINLKSSFSTLFLPLFIYINANFYYRQGGILSKGSVSLKQASNTLSTISSASFLVIFLTHNMDFTARSFTHA